jgi:hypothetical protein
MATITAGAAGSTLMRDVLALVGLLALLALAVGVGYWIGVRNTRAAHRRAEERQARIEGRPYRGGEPHNWDGAPARVSQGRIRNRRTWKLQP